MDFLRLAFGFLMFHRRTVIGILLLVGLYFFITDFVPRISKGRLEREKFAASPIEAETPKEVKGDDLVETETLDQLLRSTDPDKLLKELMRLKDLSITAKRDSIVLVLTTDIIKLSKRILELDIDLTQRKYALGALVEALLVKRLINIESKLTDETIDEEFFSKVQELLRDRDPILSSFAAASLITSSVYQFNVAPSIENLQKLDDDFNAQFDLLSQQPDQLKKFCQLILQSNISTITAVDTKPFLDRIIKRFAADPRPEIQKTGRTLEAALVFRKLDIDELVGDLKNSRPDVEIRIDELYQTLERFPEAPIRVYQISLNIIREYLIQHKVTRGLELADIISSKVLPHRSEDEIKPQIRRALDELVNLAKTLKK